MDDEAELVHRCGAKKEEQYRSKEAEGDDGGFDEWEDH
jgi:hypothetical protein